MAKLAEAVREAAALAHADDADFGPGCAAVLAKVKRGVAEVRKDIALIAQAPPDAGAWEFLLRAAAEKPACAKQVWDTASVLLDSAEWAAAFKAAERKSRLSLGKAATRDLPMVRGLAERLLVSGVAELSEMLPADGCGALPPAFCAELAQVLQAPEFPAEAGAAALASDAGRALLARAAEAAEAAPGGEGRRRVIGGGGPQKFGKGDDIPVYVCEGIHGSQQKMDIKKGLV